VAALCFLGVSGFCMSRYVLFHKPFGVLSQFTPEVSGQRTLSEFGLPARIYAVGRLDADSEGALLLVDDGPLIKALLEPGKGHERTYWAQVEGEINEQALESLRKGVTIGDYTTLPAEARRIEQPSIGERTPPIRIRKSIPDTWIELKLREGKNRQVRRMTAAVGFPTLRLIRCAIGPIELGDLKSGEWRDLTGKEVASIRSLPLKKKPRG
jgi:23S rRNA pseudouridine2457 synthase